MKKIVILLVLLLPTISMYGAMELGKIKFAIEALCGNALGSNQETKDLLREACDYMIKKAGGAGAVFGGVPFAAGAASKNYQALFGLVGGVTVLAQAGTKAPAGGGADEFPWDDSEAGMPAWMKLDRLFANDSKWTAGDALYATGDLATKYPSRFFGNTADKQRNWGYKAGQKCANTPGKKAYVLGVIDPAIAN